MTSTVRRRREVRRGYLAVSPALALVGAFVLVPLGFGVYISLTNWPLVGGYHFVGLHNYAQLASNSVFVQSILFTLEYTAIVTPLILVTGYLLAVFVRRDRPGRAVFRTLIFLPFIVGLTTVSYMAVIELQPSSGMVDVVASKLGITSATTAWTAHATLILFAVCVLVVWTLAGLTMMLLMAGMQSVPGDLYEAARADGASWLTMERRITIPLIRRSIVLSLIISVIGSLLAFNQFFIITQGGPGRSTTSVVMWIYDTAFSQMNIGLASAMSVVLVVVIALISFAQYRVLRGGDEP
jgi:multiple sugar transport system permease protein